MGPAGQHHCINSQKHSEVRFEQVLPRAVQREEQEEQKLGKWRRSFSQLIAPGSFQQVLSWLTAALGNYGRSFSVQLEVVKQRSFDKVAELITDQCPQKTKPVD